MKRTMRGEIGPRTATGMKSYEGMVLLGRRPILPAFGYSARRHMCIYPCQVVQATVTSIVACWQLPSNQRSS